MGFYSGEDRGGLMALLVRAAPSGGQWRQDIGAARTEQCYL
jgi:hypothetical protein